MTDDVTNTGTVVVANSPEAAIAAATATDMGLAGTIAMDAQQLNANVKSYVDPAVFSEADKIAMDVGADPSKVKAVQEDVAAVVNSVNAFNAHVSNNILPGTETHTLWSSLLDDLSHLLAKL